MCIRDRARGVRLAVQRVLSEPDITERARALADWSHRHGDGTVAAETLEEFVA